MATSRDRAARYAMLAHQMQLSVATPSSRAHWRLYSVDSVYDAAGDAQVVEISAAPELHCEVGTGAARREVRAHAHISSRGNMLVSHTPQATEPLSSRRAWSWRALW
jgi:hypothetical protein